MSVNRQRVKLSTESGGTAHDNYKLLLTAMSKVIQHPTRLIYVEKANFVEENPCVVMIVDDPVLSPPPRGAITVEVEPALDAAL